MLFALIKKEWQALRRDWHGLLVLFVMPSAFIVIMSLALRDTYSPQLTETLHWRFIDTDNSDMSRAVLQQLPGYSDDKRLPESTAPENELHDTVLLVQIEKGFSDAITESKLNEEKVFLHIKPNTPLPLVAAFEAALQKTVIQHQVENTLVQWKMLATMSGQTFPDTSTLTESTLVKKQLHHASTVPMTAVQQSVPAWLIFSMFFVVIPIANVVISETQHGTLRRLRSLNIPLHFILLGKVIPFYLVGLVQTVLMLIVGRWLVPTLGGDALYFTADPFAFFVLTSCTSLAAISFALLLACIARSTEQATTLGGISNILMGALGGIMVPKLVMPHFMQELTAISPMAWALDGFTQLFLDAASLFDIRFSVAALLIFAACCFSAARWQLKRRII